MIPIYEAIINDDNEGIFKISLVDYPAIESDFLAFHKDDKKEMHFSVQDEEQRIVFGVLMRADFNIYRFSEELGEFYIRYSKETIKKMAEKLMADGFHNNINLQHSVDTEGINLCQRFIKDEAKGVSPSGFEDIEDGSLFAVYKINNEEVWQSIKKGEFKGYSLEGYFEIKPIKNKSLMSKFNKMRKKIMSILMEFGEIKTDKGEIFWSGEDALQKGDEVYKEVEGEKKPLENGDYMAEDGRIIVVNDGIVEEIKEASNPEENKEEVIAEEETVEEPTEETKEPDLKAELEALKADVEELKEKVNGILSTPVVEPVAEEFEKVAIAKDINQKLSKAVEIASALKK